MYDPNRNRNQLPAPVTTGTGQYTAGTPIAPRTAQGSVPVGPSRVDFSSTPALQKLFQPAPPSTGYTQSNVNANRNANVKAAGLVAPPLTPTQPPPSQGGLPPPNLPLRKGEGQGGGELVRAAEAQTPFVAPALAAPASFTDPAGNERSFADARSAATAQGALESPAGQEKLRGEILNRTFDVTADPSKSFNLTNPAYFTNTFTLPELQFAFPGGEGPDKPVGVTLPAPGGGSTKPYLPYGTPESVISYGTPGDALANIDRDRGQPLTPREQAAVDWHSGPQPGKNADGSVGGTDVIRGTSVQGGGTGGGSAADFYNAHLLLNMQAASEMGGDLTQYLGELKAVSEAQARAPKKKEATLPTLSQFQAQRAAELTQNPDGINPADDLVFGKRGAAVAPKINTQKLYDDPKQPGFQTGQLDYTLGPDGVYREVTVERAGAAGAKPSLAQFLAKARLDPRNGGVSDEDLTNHYRKTYGR